MENDEVCEVSGPSGNVDVTKMPMDGQDNTEYIPPIESLSLVQLSEQSQSGSPSLTPPPTSSLKNLQSALNMQSYSAVAGAQSYSAVAGANTPPSHTSAIIKMKIIPPLQKQHFTTKDNFTTATNECFSAILRCFPPTYRQHLTISKSFTIVGTRHLHSINIVAPVTAQEIVSNLQITGISMLGKTVFPSTDNFLTNLPGLYPRYTQARLLHAPAQCDDETLTELLHLPADTTIIGFKRQIDTIDGMSFFNGKIACTIKINNTTHEEELRQWSLDQHENPTMIWEEIPIFAFIPSLHNCTFCKQHNKPHFGHDIAWCKHAKAHPMTPPSPPLPQQTSITTSQMPLPPPSSSASPSVVAPTSPTLVNNNLDLADPSVTMADDWQPVTKKTFPKHILVKTRSVIKAKRPKRPSPATEANRVLTEPTMMAPFLPTTPIYNSFDSKRYSKSSKSKHDSVQP